MAGRFGIMVLNLTDIFAHIKKESLLFVLLVLIFLIAVLHISAIELFWYWRVWWIDIVMHFLGGLWIALASLWVTFYSGLVKNVRRTPGVFFIVTVVSAIVVGIGWEVFEFLSGAFIGVGLSQDTFHDLFADLGGALTVFLFAVRTNNLDGE